MLAPPAGTVTLLMTDIEGSTRLWERHGESFITHLEAHNRCVREVMQGHGGYEVKTEGDSFFYVFSTAQEAVVGAIALQRALALASPGLRVRIGIHTGEPTLRDGDYFGPQVSRAARIRDAAHGGMILVSASTCALIQGHIPADASLLDRGEHRLRDLGVPERLYQIIAPDLPRDFPPLRTLEAQPNNLPAQRTSFVGRSRELNMLRELLTQGHARLITLTGPGGVGKSRLALQVAAYQLVEFPDGVWFVSLAALTDPAQVMPEIAGTVLGQTALPEEAENALIEYFRDKRVLLVLDSFEHLLSAAPLLGHLLATLPRFFCLVTSRALLHLTGEHEFHVASLPDSESMQLFLERGQAARPGFELDEKNLQAITSICQQLDGLPLAIELAAARLRGMSPIQIAQRLERRFDILSGGGRDLPDRQRTMRAVLDWSYDLLSEDERLLLAQLSVFVGGFFLDAAEEVCDAGEVLDGVFNLRDRSLLVTEEQFNETRYRMLTLVREYAASRVQEVSALRARHAEHYLRIARIWGAKVSGREQQQAMARLDMEIPNFEAALRWSAETRNWPMVAGFVEVLGEYAHTRGRISPQVYEIVARAVEALQSTQDTASLASLLFAMGAMAWMQRRTDEGETCVAMSLKYYRANAMYPAACRALSLLGLIAADQGRIEAARQHFREGLQLAEESGCRLERALILQNLSSLELKQENDAEARQLAEECLRLNRSLGDEAGSSYPLYTLGLLAWRRGDHEEGRVWLLESLRIREQMQDQPGLARACCDLARLRMEAGDRDNAALMALAARRLYASSLLPTSSEDLAVCERLQEEVAPTRWSRLSEKINEMTFQEIAALVRSLV